MDGLGSSGGGQVLECSVWSDTLPTSAAPVGACVFEQWRLHSSLSKNSNMQAERKQQNQKKLTLSERFAAMAPPKKPSKPSQAKMHMALLQHASDLAFEGFIASDPNLGPALRHLNDQRSRHFDLPHFLEVDKFAASVSRVIGDDRRSAKTLEGLVAETVCERLAAHFAVPLETIAARARFMTASERGRKQDVEGIPRFILTLRWRSH